MSARVLHFGGRRPGREGSETTQNVYENLREAALRSKRDRCKEGRRGQPVRGCRGGLTPQMSRFHRNPLGRGLFRRRPALLGLDGPQRGRRRPHALADNGIRPVATRVGSHTRSEAVRQFRAAERHNIQASGWSRSDLPVESGTSPAVAGMKVRIPPAISPGRIWGRSAWRNVAQPPAPRSRAASARVHSIFSTEA